MMNGLPRERSIREHQTALADLDITAFVHSISAQPDKFGGLSDVYQAIWSTSRGEVKVALKVIRVGNEVSDKVLRRHRRELHVWHRARHPNVQPLCGVYLGLSNLPAMISPWAENGDINRFLKTRRTGLGSPENREIELSLVKDVFCGVEYLHTHDPVIVHGDLKGANVLVSDEGAARICDFGFATMMAERSQSASKTNTKGACRWMAPELLDEDDARHTVYSDIWACGCLVLEISSGYAPYHTKVNDQQVILSLWCKEIPGRPDGISDELWELAQACVAISPITRPPAGVCLRYARILQILVSDAGGTVDQAGANDRRYFLPNLELLRALIGTKDGQRFIRECGAGDDELSTLLQADLLRRGSASSGWRSIASGASRDVLVDAIPMWRRLLNEADRGSA